MTTDLHEGIWRLRRWLRQHNISTENIRITLEFPTVPDRMDAERALRLDIRPEEIHFNHRNLTGIGPYELVGTEIQFKTRDKRDD